MSNTTVTVKIEPVGTLAPTDVLDIIPDSGDLNSSCPGGFQGAIALVEINRETGEVRIPLCALSNSNSNNTVPEKVRVRIRTVVTDHPPPGGSISVTAGVTSGGGGTTGSGTDLGEL